MSTPLHVSVLGGGMIVHDQLLPALYHLQRLGEVGEIRVCARRSASLRTLAESPALREAFPGQSFLAFPDLKVNPEATHPGIFRRVLESMKPRNLVVVAVPDHIHHPVIREALEHDQHVISVKPLVLVSRQAQEIERMARARGLFVGVEYHKRFDRRALEARRKYRKGLFGEFRCGSARLIEPWYYRRSNFQNWFTREQTDPFTYVGCHYVDLVTFITGLRPATVSLQGTVGSFPNGKVGYLWAVGRVRFENGALLSVVNGLGYPDEGAGANDQGMTLYCEGRDGGAVIQHDDHLRGVMHGTVARDEHGAAFRFVNPDYFRLAPWDGEGLRPVGYGYESTEALVRAAARVNSAGGGAAGAKALARRQAALDAIDARGILATPKNSISNDLTMEAGRLSIKNDGKHVLIEYGKNPRVRLR